MASFCQLENARWSHWNQTACLTHTAPGRQQVHFCFCYHPIVRNPAQKWIIKKNAAPVIHIQLESRIS
jgi:hypothetical protein